MFGPGDDEPLVWYEGAGTSDRRWLHADERGSVIAVSNSSGASIATNSYDEYGVPGSGNVGAFQYTGQARLPDFGLYYYKARMYSSALGQFLQTDPIGYGDGMNWYNYVGGDPVNSIDPTGWQEFESIAPVNCNLHRGDPRCGPRMNGSPNTGGGASAPSGGTGGVRLPEPLDKSKPQKAKPKPDYCSSTLYKIGDWINTGSDVVSYVALAPDIAAAGTFVGSGGVATPGSAVLAGVGLSLHGTAGTLGTVGNIFKYVAGDQRSLSNLAIDGALHAAPGPEGVKKELLKSVLGKAADSVIPDACK